jgi:hypothetical protein
MHGTRRRILRVFGEDPTPRTTKELLPTFPGVSLSTIVYHVLVLEDCGSLSVSHVAQDAGALHRSFVSTVADNVEIVAVLQATESLDDAR